MHKGNVLVIGNSGVGKSTLINAVLGKEVAKTGFGSRGTTTNLKIYEGENVPFRVIDTVGFEPTWNKERKIIHEIRKWSAESAKEGKEDNQINVIWFCVEGTSSKLFPKTIQNLSRATALWPSVPVLVVITKSYSVPDRERNIQMVHTAFAKQKRYGKNLRGVLPVVAAVYRLNDSAYAPPEGITELIDATNDLLPEGVQAAKADIAAFKLGRKRVLAHSVTAAATVSAAVVGAVPVPFPDAAILAPVEVAEINAIAKIYGIRKTDETAPFLDSLVKAGTVSLAAKAAINALKAIPGVNLGAAALNAVIAGSFAAALGEGSVYIFEQVYLGKKTFRDVDWASEIIESKLGGQLAQRLQGALKKIPESSTPKEIAGIVLEQLFGSGKGK